MGLPWNNAPTRPKRLLMALVQETDSCIIASETRLEACKAETSVCLKTPESLMDKVNRSKTNPQQI
jgi:hypothetical protein